MLEMVLVLAMIAVVAAMTWPPLVQFVSRNELEGATVGVRHEIQGARIKAIERAITYQFRYEPGGHFYAVLPYDPPELASTPVQGATSGPGGSKVKPPPAKLSKLPATCKFVLKPGQTTERIPQKQLSLLTSNEPLAGVSWSVPILFFVDGSADNATLFVQDLKQEHQKLTLRGMTGGVDIGPVTKGGAIQ
jgi:type II secretory pathway pseudopilin PulG